MSYLTSARRTVLAHFNVFTTGVARKFAEDWASPWGICMLIFVKFTVQFGVIVPRHTTDTFAGSDVGKG